MFAPEQYTAFASLCVAIDQGRAKIEQIGSRALHVVSFAFKSTISTFGIARTPYGVAVQLKRIVLRTASMELVDPLSRQPN